MPYRSKALIAAPFVASKTQCLTLIMMWLLFGMENFAKLS